MYNKFYILSKTWARHGSQSGYERILDFIKVPFRLLGGFYIPHRIGLNLKKRPRLLNYRTETLSKEWLPFLRFFECKTIHILYADMDYYYLHYLKRFPSNLRTHTLIATFHHPPYELEKRLGYDRKKVLGALDKIIVMGNNQKHFLQQYTNAHIQFIPHGIDTHFFTYDLSTVRLNQILLIGISHRDHVRNIAIIRAVLQQSKTRFVVLIPKSYASLYEGIDGVQVISQKISDSELLLYYQQSKGLLLSLIDCTASNSILEALACGCPIITNNVGAVKDYIPEDSGVPVFETDDLDGSVRYILRLLEDTPFLNDISRKQHTLAQKYDWKVIAKTTEDFIFPQL